jgi:hypothetical protein
MRVREKKDFPSTGGAEAHTQYGKLVIVNTQVKKRLSCEQVKKTAGFSTRAYLCVRELENSAVFDEMRRK